MVAGLSIQMGPGSTLGPPRLNTDGFKLRSGVDPGFFFENGKKPPLRPVFNTDICRGLGGGSPPARGLGGRSPLPQHEAGSLRAAAPHGEGETEYGGPATAVLSTGREKRPYEAVRS